MNAAEVLIVGGGPAGMMAGLLFARAGVRTLVLEKHADFLRDFRGDTVHPSTLDLMDELGLLDAFLRLPHDRVEDVGAEIGGRTWRIADFRHLPGPGRFVAMMPQWHFLDFLAGAARRYPSFSLRMNTTAVDLLWNGARVAGVRTGEGEELRATLTILADGRGSILRNRAALPLEDIGAPIDVFWFRVPKAQSEENETRGILAAGEMIVAIDRGDYYQCARLIRKGAVEAIRARGLDVFRREVAGAAPVLGEGIGALAGWDEVKLLTVSLDRLKRWHRQGLLAIGDAAHAMSPVGGVGINLAIQDAVAAANILAAAAASGVDPDPLLGKVAQRRLMPVRVIQSLQRAVHRQVIGAALDGRAISAPWPVRLISRAPLLQRLPARIIGLGVRREHIRSPDAYAGRPGITPSLPSSPRD